MRDDDDSPTFTGTVPDLDRRLRQERTDEVQKRILLDFASAGRTLEYKQDKMLERIERLEQLAASREGERKARRQMVSFLQWAVGIVIALAAYLAGQHSAQK